ncbi:MAG: DNA polymerase III subunit delta [Bacilli bacterium]|nr:DNA polymerase III subunit delta [Bacilli bacterium]
MIYLLYGKELLLIEKKIEEIIKKEHLSEYSINKYDLENDSLNSIIEDATTISMFGDKKGIVVANSYIFTGTTKKSSIEQNTDLLLSYLDHFNPDTILIFFTLSEKLDERKKITKSIKKVGSVIEIGRNQNLNTIVKEMFEDYEIKSNVIQLLIDRVGDNLQILKQECDKIKTYKDKEKTVTEQDILNLTTKNIDADIFKLIENIVLKRKQTALEAYQEMIKRNEEPIKILILLANQFRIMYQAKELSKKGYTANDIASTLEVHPYRLKLALEKSKDFSSSILLHYLEELADLDSNIKSGIVEKDLALELFILKI